MAGRHKRSPPAKKTVGFLFGKMKLLDTDIIKFQNLYKSEFGMEISKNEAYEKGIKLLSLMSAVYRPMTEKDYEDIENHRLNTLPQLITSLGTENHHKEQFKDN